MRQVRGHQLNFSHSCLAAAPQPESPRVSDNRGSAQTGFAWRFSPKRKEEVPELGSAPPQTCFVDSRIREF